MKFCVLMDSMRSVLQSNLDASRTSAHANLRCSLPNQPAHVFGEAVSATTTMDRAQHGHLAFWRMTSMSSGSSCKSQQNLTAQHHMLKRFHSRFGCNHMIFIQRYPIWYVGLGYHGLSRYHKFRICNSASWNPVPVLLAHAFVESQPR